MQSNYQRVLDWTSSSESSSSSSSSEGSSHESDNDEAQIQKQEQRQLPADNTENSQSSDEDDELRDKSIEEMSDDDEEDEDDEEQIEIRREFMEKYGDLSKSSRGNGKIEHQSFTMYTITNYAYPQSLQAYKHAAFHPFQRGDKRNNGNFLIREVFDIMRRVSYRRLISKSEPVRLNRLLKLLHVAAKWKKTSTEFVWMAGMYALQMRRLLAATCDNYEFSNDQAFEWGIKFLQSLYENHGMNHNVLIYYLHHLRLETSLFSLRLCKLDDAIERLEAIINARGSILGKTPLHRGLAGLMSFGRWDMSLKNSSFKSEDDDYEMCGNDYWYYAELSNQSDTIINFDFRTALHHFESARDLNDYSLDFAFVDCLVKIYLVEKRYLDAFDLLMDQIEDGRPHAYYANIIFVRLIEQVFLPEHEECYWTEREELERMVVKFKRNIFMMDLSLKSLRRRVSENEEEEMEHLLLYLERLAPIYRVTPSKLNSYITENYEIWKCLWELFNDRPLAKSQEEEEDPYQRIFFKLKHHFKCDINRLKLDSLDEEELQQVKTTLAKMYFYQAGIFYKTRPYNRTWKPFGSRYSTSANPTTLLPLKFLTSFDCKCMVADIFGEEEPVANVFENMLFTD